jgi:hypothetical protein
MKTTSVSLRPAKLSFNEAAATRQKFWILFLENLQALVHEPYPLNWIGLADRTITHLVDLTLLQLPAVPHRRRAAASSPGGRAASAEAAADLEEIQLQLPLFLADDTPLPSDHAGLDADQLVTDALAFRAMFERLNLEPRHKMPFGLSSLRKTNL